MTIRSGKAGRPFPIGRAYTIKEGWSFPFDAIRRTTAMRALQADFGQHVQEQGRIGLQISVHQGFGLLYGRFRNAAPAALIGVSRIGEAIAHDAFAARERRPNHLFEMLRAGGEHQQQLSLRYDG